MREFSLSIPTRILGMRTLPVIQGTSLLDGREKRWGYCIPLDSQDVKLDTSFMRSQRVDTKHSWCLHASPVSPPNLIAGKDAQYMDEWHYRNLKEVLTGGRDSVTAGEVVTDNFDLKDARTLWYAEWTDRSWTTYTQYEFVSTPWYDTIGLSGKHPRYISERVVVDDVEIDPVSKRVTKVSLWRFTALVRNFNSWKFDFELYKGWIDLVNHVADWGPDVRKEISESFYLPYMGGYDLRWHHEIYDSFNADQYYYLTTDPAVITAKLTEDHCTIGTSCSAAFKFGEPTFISAPQKIDLVHLDLDQTFKVKQLQSEAFLAAADQIPRMNDNTIQIVKDLISILWDIAQGNFSILKSLPKSLSDLWLAKRYTVDTSILDFRDVGSFLMRTYDRSIFGSFYCKGKKTIDGVTCVCHFRAKSVILSTLHRLLYVLDRYGLCPDFYIIWDSIPYSFIVDWLAPVGDAVSRTDAQVRYSKLNYEYEFVSYSLLYRVPARLSQNLSSLFGTFNVECYSRWYEYETPDSLLWSYQYSPASDRSLTWLKRGFDVAALISS